ncbi:MAG: tRNA uridine-5-carboxymethylaminomethyl(34) synthesis GTPase MnmE [Thermodesulfobacteriota bacterium]
MDSSTIAAIATPSGSGGIGIIRISGPQAVAVAAAVFQPSKSGSRDADLLESHRFYHGYIVDPKIRTPIDEVYLVVMKAPRSYTREDVAEIHTHGGPVVLKTVLELILNAGARLATAGEFTLRAFLNGRVDLSQAEGVADLINAKTEKALRIAASQVKGALRKEIESLRRLVLDSYTAYEAAIDFPEEMEEFFIEKEIRGLLEQRLIPDIEDLLQRYRTGHVFKDGIRVAIAGRPNVGKSSMMNSLLDKDRAIVSPVPGTTRDFIEEQLLIEGISVFLMDTAGLWNATDPVERLGIQKTMDSIENADLILFMVESCGFPDSGDLAVYDQIRNKPKILVLNKSDMISEEKEIPLPEAWQEIPRVKTSVLNGRGIEEVKQAILSLALNGNGIDPIHTSIPNIRHKIALERTRSAILEFDEGIRTGRSPELLAMDLKEAADALGEILGVTAPPDILDEIFSRFCIGK